MSGEICANPVEIDLEECHRLGIIAAGRKDHIYFHWSAGHYDNIYDDYHIVITVAPDGSIHIYKTCNELCDDIDRLIPRKSHTWKRNTNGIGIGLACCAGAEACEDWENNPEQAIANLGDEPPTKEQLEVMYRVGQAIADSAGIPYDPEYMMTHCEAAFLDDYGPGSGDPETRWDLWYINDNGVLKQGGQLIRDKAAWYSRENPV